MSMPGAMRSLFVEVGLIDRASAQMVTIDKAADKTKASLAGVAAEAKKAGDSYRNVFLGVGAAMGVGGAFGFSYFKAGAKDLAEYKDAYVTFRKNMGSETDQMIAEMKRASGGVINETELIHKANLAMLLGIDKDALAPMTKMARAAARQLGGNVSDYYNSLMVGTARESKMWLDNLGIIIDIDAANKKYAQTLGISASALTTEQQKIAFVNEVLAHQNDLLGRVDFTQESMNEEMQKSTVSWGELQREITEGALPVIMAVLKTTNGLIDIMRALPGPVKGVIGIVGVLATGLFLLGSTTLLSAVAFGMLRKNMMDATNTAGFWAAVQAMLIPESITLSGVLGLVSAGWNAVALSEIAAIWWMIPLLAAGALLYDLCTNGWENSALGRFIGWLGKDALPILNDRFTGLVNGVKGLWDWITKIPDAIASSWNAVTNHPLFQVASILFAATPMGMAINSARLVSTAAPVVMPTAEWVIASTSSRNVRYGDVHVSQKTEINLKEISKSQLEEIKLDSAKEAGRRVKDAYQQDFHGAGA